MSQEGRRSLNHIKKLIKIAQEESLPQDAFLAELNRTIEMAQEQRKPSKTYKPSSMFCIRNMYYQRVGRDVDDDRPAANFVGICESGSARHEHIQSYIKRMSEFNSDCEFIDVAEFIKRRNLTHLEVVSQNGYETKIYNKSLNISFLCDGIIKFRNHYYILEIKTEVSFKYNRRDDVDENHIPQASAYSLSLEVDDVLFLYENRDLCQKKTFILHVTEDMKFDILSKIEKADEFYIKKKTPPIPEGFPNKICDYCNYKTYCSKE